MKRILLSMMIPLMILTATKAGQTDAAPTILPYPILQKKLANGVNVVTVNEAFVLPASIRTLLEAL